MRRLLMLLLTLGLLAPAAAASAGGLTGNARWVERQAARHGTVLYAALHSLEAFRAVLEAVEPVPGWRGHRPDALPVGSEHAGAFRRALVRRLDALERPRAQALRERLAQWCALEAMLFQGLQAYRSFSLEAQMAVLFSRPRIKPLFERALRSRGLEPATADPALVGSTLSSQELTGMVYAVLHRVSGWPEGEQLGFVAGVYEVWADGGSASARVVPGQS